ncbi:ABC transporter ATP-binding protein [Pseudoclavibacter endophyticus]|uniref:ABC transporter ATP-binding protein n=1 Tax=Pseudoclavibacter endophyticus TaxID=1778590 RepID=A0A6H9WWK5_9MICO|nr:ABC transporter ATP-binding protein [Pseudoclavibacter endophyticus]
MLRLDARELGLTVGEATILRDVTASVEAASIAVIGANGSGKTTFARLATGLVAPTRGSLRVAGFDAVDDAASLRRASGLLFSNPDVQIIMPTVAEDVAFTLKGRGVHRREIPVRVDDALARVGITELRDAAAHTLSGGQKQLLAVAAVLVAEPTFLVADEPTAYLDGANARRIARLLLDPATPPVVLVTHDLALAARCDVALRFRGGTLASVGDPAAEIAAYEAELDSIDAHQHPDRGGDGGGP